MKTIPLSILDLSPIVQDGTAGQALRHSLDLAQHAERWAYNRFWLAEHHNMPGIASAATAVALAFIGAGTTTIRIGSGGIMLPNHAPLIVAEQFGTLEALYPGRIDLGLGRAPGTDQSTARALRRNLGPSEDSFPNDVVELMNYFQPALPTQPVRAVPGAGAAIDVWLLGSSLFSAQLAAALGLPFAFASHFAPDLLMPSLRIYSDQFRPSAQLKAPYAMAGVSVIAADTVEEARRLFTSQQQSFINLRRGRPGPLPPPVHSMDGYWTPMEQEMVEHTLMYAVVGTRDIVARGLAQFVEQTGVDEVIATGHIYDHAARLHSFEILAEAAALNPLPR
jgi:luciferase family oxidoreductase group 1